MIYLSDCLCLGSLVPSGSTVNPCHTQRHDNGDYWRPSKTVIFLKIIICTCKHMYVSMCSFTLQNQNLLLLSLLSSGRGKKNEPQSALPAIISKTTSFSWAPRLEARGWSQLSFPHFLKTFYQSGSSAESHWIWPVGLRLTTTGQLSAGHERGCVFYPSFPPLISMCLHFSSSTCPPLHTSSPWPGYMTGELTSPSMCVCECVCVYVF